MRHCISCEPLPSKLQIQLLGILRIGSILRMFKEWRGQLRHKQSNIRNSDGKRRLAWARVVEEGAV